MTLETKMEIVRELQGEKSQRIVAEKFGVAKSTVGDIWKYRQKIEDCVLSSESLVFAKKRCIVRDPKFELVDAACWKWFCQQRSKGAPVSGVLLQEKARVFFAKLYLDADPESFKGSTGWLRKFNLRHGIKNTALRGEILSANMSAVGPFREELQKLVESEGYSRDQIFNADETGLWWRLTPSSSLNSAGKTRAANFKKAKDRVTLLACANASGTHRLPLMLINKSRKPRCFKHIDMNNLPVHYYAQNKSWMDCRLFTEWFHERFVPSVRKFCRDKGIEEKALLLVDNAPSHPSSATLHSEDGRVKTLFLPPNTTSVIQPMDQGVLDPCKKRYKRKLLSHIIMENESPHLSVPEILKKVTLKDVVYWISAAWNEASNDSLSKAWKHLLPESDTPETSEDSTPSNEVCSDMVDMAAPLGPDVQEAFAEWFDSDSSDAGHQIIEDDEIVADVLAQGNSDNESEEEEAMEDCRSVTPHEAFNALETSLLWLESQNTDPAHLLLVKKWRDTAARMRQESLRQTSITSFLYRTE